MATPNPKLQQFDKQLKAVVVPALAAHGFTFTKVGREFQRPAPRGSDVYHLVSFQVGPATDSSAGEYTVELGVYYPATARKLGQDVLKPGIRYSSLNARVRLGFLFVPQEDRWWKQLAAASGQEKQLQEVAEQIVSLGLPWFAETDTDENAVRFNTGKKPKKATK